MSRTALCMYEGVVGNDRPSFLQDMAKIKSIKSIVAQNVVCTLRKKLKKYYEKKYLKQFKRGTGKSSSNSWLDEIRKQPCLKLPLAIGMTQHSRAMFPSNFHHPASFLEKRGSAEFTHNGTFELKPNSHPLTRAPLQCYYYYWICCRSD